MSSIDEHAATESRRTDQIIELIAHKVTRMEQSMDRLTDAITKLAVIEREQVNQSAATERAFQAIEKLDARTVEIVGTITARVGRIEDRVHVLETNAPITSKATGWVFDAVKWCVVIVAAYVAAKTGLK